MLLPYKLANMSSTYMYNTASDFFDLPHSNAGGQRSKVRNLFAALLLTSWHVRCNNDTLSDCETYITDWQGCICQIFTGGSEFRLAMTDRATIAGMEVAKLVPWNSLLN